MIILIRLCLFSYHVSEFALDYVLSMLPNHGDFGTILGPTVAGPGPGPGPGGSNLPPTGGGSGLPPTGSATTNSILASIQNKLDLQAHERVGRTNVSIYSGTRVFSPSAVLTPQERYELSQLVGHDEVHGTSGIYNTVIKETPRYSRQYELRVVRNIDNRPLSSFLDDVSSTVHFRQY